MPAAPLIRKAPISRKFFWKQINQHQ